MPALFRGFGVVMNGQERAYSGSRVQVKGVE